MMTTRVLMVLMGSLLLSHPAAAQQRTLTGKVTNEQGAPIAGVTIVARTPGIATTTNSEGNYSIRVTEGLVLQYRIIGYAPEERTVGTESVINVQLRRVAVKLDEVVVTALGQTTEQRAIGTAQQSIQGVEIA